MVERTSFVEYLMEFGLTRQEATIYQCLLGEGKATGYEVSKLTGISRSNAYNALANMTEKGAACLVEEGNTRKYVPMPLDEFCKIFARHADGSLFHDFGFDLFQDRDLSVRRKQGERIVFSRDLDRFQDRVGRACAARFDHFSQRIGQRDAFTYDFHRFPPRRRSPFYLSISFIFI